MVLVCVCVCVRGDGVVFQKIYEAIFVNFDWNTFLEQVPTIGQWDVI